MKTLKETLQEIKDEVAIEDGYTSWEQVGVMGVSDYLVDEIAKRFAIEVAKEALINAHDACLKGSNGGPEAALRSILKQTNIPKL